MHRGNAGDVYDLNDPSYYLTTMAILALLDTDNTYKSTRELPCGRDRRASKTIVLPCGKDHRELENF